MLKGDIINIAIKAKEASRSLAAAKSTDKNDALRLIADNLNNSRDYIFRANKKDIENARRSGLIEPLIDRLTITSDRMSEMVRSVLGVLRLSDPVGRLIRMRKRPNGLLIKKVRVPIGVIGIIYESRPDVTCDCAILCIKSGNSVILKGGSEAIHTNTAIYRLLRESLQRSDVPENSIGFIQSTDRQAVNIMLELDQYIDLIIPRGGEELIRTVAKKSRIPVIKHYKGVCHVYVDEYADLNMARDIALNAKVQRPATCNAMETLLVHKDIAKKFLPRMIEEFQRVDVEIRGCPETRKISLHPESIKGATEDDWYTEYLDLILSVKIVSGIDEAIGHIRKYGSSHSDAIVTEDYENAIRFTNEVDSACVYVNASTRFTDGYQFGLGAEIGISTDKLHARGPMGLEELTTYKYIIFGRGQVRR